MKRVYFVRHGESEGNVSRIIGGKEFALTENGQMQAAQLAERIEHIDIDTLVVSDFVRAQETIAPIAKVTQLPVETLSLFGEVLPARSFFGLHEDGEEFLNYLERRNSDPEYKVADEENFNEIHERVNAARSYLENHDADNILVVSHGFFLGYFFACLLFNNATFTNEVLEAAKKIKLSNTGISLLEYDGSWRLIIMNDHAHFAE